MTAIPGQSMILSGGYSPWQAPLAALFSGLSAAGQPGGWSNFGQGVGQGVQNFQAGQQNQQMMQLRQMQMQRAEEDARRANQEDAQRQAKLDLIKQTLAGSAGSPTPTQQHGNYGAATGGIQTASAQPMAAMFDDPQQSALFSQYAQVDPEGAFQMLVEKGFAEPKEFKPNIEEFYSDDGKTKYKGYIDQNGNVVRLGGNAPLYAPQQGPQQPERVRLALEAGLTPDTPEYRQFLLGKDDTPPGLLQGTGLDQQMYNIVLTGTKSGDTSTPEYAAAYAQLAMPKVTFDPVTQKMVSVAPDMSWAKKPTGAATPTPPAAPAQPGVETTQLPGATVTSTPGAPVFTENQGKAATFADRIGAANSELESLSAAGTDVTQSSLSKIPLVGNYAISSDRQKFEQAERDFINAVLRRESGAAIAESEFESARRQYIPQPGDSKEVLAQKKAARERVLGGMSREAGPFYNKDGGEDYQSMYGLTPTQ